MNPQNNNCYGYALSNPLRFTDPTGYDGFDDVYTGPGMQAWVHPEQDGSSPGMGYGSGGGGDDNGFHYSYTDHAYEDANGNIVGWDYVFNNFVQPNAAFTINFTDLTAFGTDANPYQYFSLWVNGKRWNSSDGLGALQNMIDDALQGRGGSAGGGDSKHDSPINVGIKINGAVDKTVTLTSANVYAAQKFAGSAAGDIVELTSLKVLGRITGGLSIYYNSKTFFQNPQENWWNGVEAVGQFAAIAIGYTTGIEEIELIYNVSTLTMDVGRMTMEKYKQEHP